MDSARPDEQYQIVDTTDRPGGVLRVLKYGDTFGVFDPRGDITPEPAEQGIYHDGTRFISRFELLLGRHRPLLLSSTISNDNVVFVADLTNPDLVRDGVVAIPRGQIHIYRSRVLGQAACVDRIRAVNYGQQPVRIPLSLRFDADFADVFEVRGTRRAVRGHRRPDSIGSEYVMTYRGLDGVERRSRVTFLAAAPPDLFEGGATFVAELSPLGSLEFEIVLRIELDGHARAEAVDFTDVANASRRTLASRADRVCSITSSNDALNRWLRRSTADLDMMLTETHYGLYPYAGIPWFSTPFGRDGIITALEVLWTDPEVARGVLLFLAQTQATGYSDAQDAQPGKIIHEMRGGEMAALREVPFGRYYGSADATPLFVVLARAYLDRTHDLATIDRLWPSILAALDWMRSAGDIDGDGFIEYARCTESGLVQQGWKDSHDSVFHADGRLAEAPIALCEVQAYAYRAWHDAAHLARLRGEMGLAEDWAHRADHLRTRFEAAFWCEDIGTYALALDGEKQRCQVRTSNPGHCLFSGIVSPDRARRVEAALMDDSCFAGWGMRTVAAGEARYNPMAYHNGSVWPHDNAIAAAGLSAYGCAEAAQRLFSAMLDLSQAVDLNRMPELICGFPRRSNENPTLYPVACSPQSWAAGAVFLFLQACLGLRIEAEARRVSFMRARLPDTVRWLEITNLRVADGRVDLLLERHTFDVGVTVLQRQGDVEIVALK